MSHPFYSRRRFFILYRAFVRGMWEEYTKNSVFEAKFFLISFMVGDIINMRDYFLNFRIEQI